MRSHLINIPTSDPRRNDEKPPKKKLPPLSTDQSSHEKKKRSNLPSKEASIQEKACKECGKKFQSWKALFGHMKCHSTNTKAGFDNQDSRSDGKQITDSQSDNEGTTPRCRKKRSDRIKRYKSAATITNSSSSLTIETDHHHEQQEEEVALSLIILSRDKGEWGRLSSVVESSDNSPKTARISGFDSKTVKTPSRTTTEAKTRKLESLNHEIELERDEFEVNSPKNPIIKNQFEREGRNKPSRKRNNSLLSQETDKSSGKFACSICKKGFPSYQALGGHRASHKKFKGCCAPREENSLETENSHNRSDNNLVINQVKSKKGKDHECPICFKVFASGQALGGHKRSHLILDQIKKSDSPPREKPSPPEIRGFLDLNLPAPAEEEDCGEFKPWWIAGGGGSRPPPLLGLLSTS